MVDVGNVTPSVNKDDTRVLTLNETHSREDECRTSADNQRNEKLKVAAAVTTKKSTTKGNDQSLIITLFDIHLHFNTHNFIIYLVANKLVVLHCLVICRVANKLVVLHCLITSCHFKCVL